MSSPLDGLRAELSAAFAPLLLEHSLYDLGRASGFDAGMRAIAERLEQAGSIHEPPKHHRLTHEGCKNVPLYRIVERPSAPSDGVANRANPPPASRGYGPE